MGPRRFGICLTALLSACGLIVGPASGSCAFFIEWNGVHYDAGNFDRPVAFGASLGEAIVPPCEDEGGAGCEHEDSEKVPVFRLPGVDPHVAVGGPSPSGPRGLPRDGVLSSVARSSLAPGCIRIGAAAERAGGMALR
jgi:hypothetical protein